MLAEDYSIGNTRRISAPQATTCLHISIYGRGQFHFFEQNFHASRQRPSAGSAARQGQVVSLSTELKVYTRARESSQASTGSAEAFPSIKSQNANLQTYT